MNSFWIRLGIGAGVVAVVVVGASALAAPDPEKKDLFSCGTLRHGDACATTCEDSVYTQGLCVDKKNHVVEFKTVQCCCCTEFWKNHSYHFSRL